MSYDGNPPSVFENQVEVFNANGSYYGASGDSGFVPVDVLPIDYMAHGLNLNATDYSTQWLSSPKDSMLGMVVERADRSGGDSLVGYKRYVLDDGGCKELFASLRQSVIIAQRHPASKRMAIEASTQAWGLLTHSGSEMVTRVAKRIMRTTRIIMNGWSRLKRSLQCFTGQSLKGFLHSTAHRLLIRRTRILQTRGLFVPPTEARTLD